MMKLMLRYPVLAVIVVLMISACATPNKLLPVFDAQQIDRGRYDAKVDHLIFVLDASSSMADSYQQYEKLDRARGVIRNFNATMPDVDVAATLRSFGHDPSVSSRSSDALYPSQAYSRTGLDSAIDKVHTAGGSSPLGRALKDAAADLEGLTAPVAMVIVSDGKDMASTTLAAAQALKAGHAGRICIYTVQVGDAADGKRLLGQIAGLTGCGKALSAEELDSGPAMAAFVTDVLLAAKNDSDGDGVADDKDRCPDTPAGITVDPSGCPLDSDGDGVADHKDACPGTPKGVEVDGKGCAIPVPVPIATHSGAVTPAGTFIFEGIQFENNKAELRESSVPALQEIAGILKAEPGLKIEIHGHTDGSGARSYNQDLSKRRAEAVKAYLVSQGIAAERLTTRGYGPDRPIDSNSTKEGRARNRRVEIKPNQ
jgi:OOP family OmpA-OmpF porin